MINTIILSWLQKWLPGADDFIMWDSSNCSRYRYSTSLRYSDAYSSIDNAVLWKSVANLHCLQSKPDPIQRASVATSPSVHAATSFTWPRTTTTASYSPRRQLTSLASQSTLAATRRQLRHSWVTEKPRVLRLRCRCCCVVVFAHLALI